MRTDPGWGAKLVKSYPDLFHAARDTLTAEGWPAVDDGWCDLLDRACRRVREAVRADGGSFRATQIKEKFGSLRCTPPRAWRR